MIRAGDRVYIRPEWQDPGDDKITFTAAEDEDGGRVLIRAHIGFTVEPVSVVNVDMLEATPCEKS